MFKARQYRVLDNVYFIGGKEHKIYSSARSYKVTQISSHTKPKYFTKNNVGDDLEGLNFTIYEHQAEVRTSTSVLSSDILVPGKPELSNILL